MSNSGWLEEGPEISLLKLLRGLDDVEINEQELSLDYDVEAKAAEEMTLENLIWLRQVLTDRFEEEELRTLCFDLGVKYSSLPAQGVAGKARELVIYLDNRGQLLDLAKAGKRLRPDISWGDILSDEN
jgi:hypothetical protein